MFMWLSINIIVPDCIENWRVHFLKLSLGETKNVLKKLTRINLTHKKHQHKTMKIGQKKLLQIQNHK